MGLESACILQAVLNHWMEPQLVVNQQWSYLAVEDVDKDLPHFDCAFPLISIGIKLRQFEGMLASMKPIVFFAKGAQSQASFALCRID